MVVRATTSTTAAVPFGVLDVYTGASVAYSLRKLRGAYSGAAIRIRRSSDNAEVDVPFNGVPIAGTTNLEDFLKSFAGGFGKNGLIYTDDLSVTEWVKLDGSTISANFDSAPDGSLTADKWVEGTITARPRIRLPAASAQNGKNYVLSFYAKPAGRKYLDINFFNSTTLTFVDIDAAVRVSGSTNVRLTKLPGGSGWTRVEVWGAFTQATGGYRSDLYMSDSASNTSYLGDGTSGMVLTGFQIEEGTEATTYDYRFNSATTGVSAFVTTWYDQSGNTNNAVQPTAASQPLIVSNGIINKKDNVISILFDGSNDRLVSSSNIGISGNQQFSIMLLSTFSLPSQQVSISFGTAASGAGYHFMGSNSGNRLWCGFGGGVQLADVLAINHNNLRLYSIYRTGANGTDWTIRSNKTLLDFAPPNNNAVNVINTPLHIGAWVAGSNWANINCSELIIFNSNQIAVSDPIETNSISYYGLT